MRLAVVLVIALVGCQDWRADEEAKAHTTAVSDFQCTDVQMTTVYEEPHGSWGTYHATGCEQTAYYRCDVTGGGNYSCTEGDYTTVSSTLTVNGDWFVPDGEDMCHSGQREGKDFYGVDLNVPGGDTVRIIQNPDLSVEVVAISLATSTSSPPMKDCATVQLRDAGNGSPSAGITGDAKLDCTAGPWVIKGDVKFQGCD
jgi:hypothetical protein